MNNQEKNVVTPNCHRMFLSEDAIRLQLGYTDENHNDEVELLTEIILTPKFAANISKHLLLACLEHHKKYNSDIGMTISIDEQNGSVD